MKKFITDRKYNAMLTLDQIALEFNTDKSSAYHDYCRIYERHFEPLRNEEICMLELGYGGNEDPLSGGESAKMWKEYFSDAAIYVLDINDKLNVPDGINFIHASQTEPGILEHWFLYNSLDIVIDDASHLSSLTIKSFEILFPLLKSGGYYAIEDLHSSYDTGFYGNIEASTDPAQGNTAMNYFKRIVDDVNKDFIEPAYHLGFDIEWMHFYKDLIIIKKK